MTGKTLYDKLWDSHVVRADPDGTCLLYIDRHLMHEVTSPQAFEGLRLVAGAGRCDGGEADPRPGKRAVDSRRWRDGATGFFDVHCNFAPQP